MDRRSVLRAIGGVSVGASIAGCLGGDSSGDESSQPQRGHYGNRPTPSDGGFDAYTRTAVPFFEGALPNDATMVVENISGGGTMTSVQQAMNSEADGHTMTIWEGFHAASFHVGRENLNFDIRDASHIGVVTQSPFFIISMNRTGISTWNDLASNISDYNIATAGKGSFPHTSWLIMGELTGKFFREEMNFVHYGGTGEVLGSLKRGETDFFMVSSSSGRKVVDSLDASMFVSFVQDPDSEAGQFFEDYAENYAFDLDVNNIDQFADSATFRRFFTGPPGVLDDVLQTQRDAFMEIVNDDEFVTEANDRGRPVINSGDHEAVSDALETSIDIVSSKPYKSMLQDVVA